MNAMLDFVRRHKTGQPGQLAGVYSVCSAHPLVIEAALRQAIHDITPILIEATSNQVNQYGGYTGMTPEVFRTYVLDIAKRVGFPPGRVVLGGDHLGPNCWQNLSADEAMAKSDQLIHDYVSAGFRKIHLDCSMSCKDDPVRLTDAIVAQRAARLCAVAEAAWHQVGGDAPVYVIGTEVPTPGGAHEDLGQLQVTTTSAAATTMAAHQEAWRQAGLGQVWSRIVGLVVQPGVEFDHHKVIDYQPLKAGELSALIESDPTLVYEAHSTDYQTTENLHQLVQGHFAILKVGPGVTYALREMLWALAEMEEIWIAKERRSNFKQIVLETMKSEPANWQKYYGDPETQDFDMQFSLSDRIRYYWTHPAIRQVQATMLGNLEKHPVPLTLLSQYCPNQYLAIRRGQLKNNPSDILQHGVAAVLYQYRLACGMN